MTEDKEGGLKKMPKKAIAQHAQYAIYSATLHKQAYMGENVVCNSQPAHF
jgi:hypothetical protein